MKRLFTRFGIAVTFLLGLLLGGVFSGVALANLSPMRAAFNSLSSAESQITAAPPDKYGHREAAIKLVRQALVEVAAAVAEIQK